MAQVRINTVAREIVQKLITAGQAELLVKEDLPSTRLDDDSVFSGLTCSKKTSG